jgi:oxalate decarboxylase/phosphoglucose isomerase-like protein (cupin superfamily)/mannose-6-phosphate isomerase-like protein (cupin superfamily)
METAAEIRIRDQVPERLDTYARWQAAQKIPVVTGFFVEDIDKVELAYWDLKGAPAAFVVLDGSGGVNDAQIVEIPPAGKLKPQKHMYEEMVYVAKGHGMTSVWQRNGSKHSFEWGPGSLFAIPLNAAYQHFNSSGTEPARLFSVTNSSFMINLFHNTDFIFGCDYAFTDRFDGEAEGYFSREEVFGRLYMTTNFVPDLFRMKLGDWSARGKGSSNMKFDLAGQTMGAHVSEFPVGTYKKSHRHGPGAHVIILTGRGYSLLWPDGGEVLRVDWQPGSVVVPPNQWFHQHLNAGATPARYLALRWENWRYRFTGVASSEGTIDVSLKDGGGQIEFEDEDPSIHRTFEATVANAGAQCRMGAYHPFCTHKTEKPS